LPEEFTNRTWAGHVLNLMGAPDTKNNVDNLTRWMAHENHADAWTGTAGKNNPLNNGLGSGGGEGLGSYKDLESAAEFTAKNLDNKHFGYPKIKEALMNDAPPEQFSSAVVHSQWAAGHYGVGSAGAGKYTTKDRPDDFMAKSPPPAEVSASESFKSVDARRAGHPPHAEHHTPNNIPVQHAPSGQPITIPEVTIVGEVPKPHTITLPEVTIVGEVPKSHAPAPHTPAPHTPMDPHSVIVDGVVKGPHTPVHLSGDVSEIHTNAKTGMTTIDFTDKRGAERSVSFKDPIGTRPDGEPIRHPLAEMVATMDKNAERGTMKIAIDGKGNTDYAVGNARDVDTGHSGPGAPKDMTANDLRSPAVNKADLDAAIRDVVQRDTPSPTPAQTPAKQAVATWDR
jgi:hypothetical protein